MHWVDRGPAPPGLDHVRDALTPDWVAHYRDNTVEKPSDSRWQDFSSDLRSSFHGNCGYCFDLDTGEIVAKFGLTEQQHSKAWQTIDDLGLNDMGHRNNRRSRISEVRMLLEFLDETAAPDMKHFVMSRAHHRSELSSVTRAALAESGYSVETD